jgi:putative glycosyltransferase
MKLSIVSTMYRSALYLAEFHQRIISAAGQLGVDYEIILVNDGSPDDSLQRALERQRTDPRIRIVDLSRNFGHHHAAVAGLSHAEGDRIFLLDIDLEEKPEWLTTFWQAMDASGSDVVFGVRETRRGSLTSRLMGGLFYSMFNYLSETKIPPNLCTVRLMTREYVQALLTIRDRNLFLAGNCAWAGFTQTPIPVQKTPRRERSTYTFRRSFKLFFDAVSSFSSYPLRAIFLTGLAIATVSGILGVEMLMLKLTNPSGVVLGFSSIIVSVWFLGGLMIFFLGVIGLYLSKVFNEVKDRPRFIVRRVYQTTPPPLRSPGLATETAKE